jgi:hypothetical protein
MIPSDDPGELDWSATFEFTIPRPSNCAEEILYLGKTAPYVGFASRRRQKNGGVG